jgi:hypothetical protein
VCTSVLNPNCPGDKEPPANVPSETPELDAFALFGTGLFGMGGYALTRLRARRKPPTS